MATQKKRRSKYFNENRERLRLLKLSTNEISNLWYDAQTKAINLGLQTSYVNNNTTQLYSFSDYPELNKQMVKVVNTLTTDAVNAINAITEDAWQTANLKTDALIANLAATTGIDPKLLETFNQNNLNALAAFQNRKVAGMNLSKRVWNITGTFTQEMELALSVALAEGRSADDISRDVRHLLKYPDKLFRRVRNEFGQLVLSKAAQAFHPGRGVYRSSYKNALRLSATETNMAYLKSEHTRWDAMPFIVGYKIETCKQNHPKPDICDDLSGTYPKTFVFTGWHPFCRCITQAVMSSEKHFVQWLKNHEDAEDYTPPAGEVVKDVPQNFKTWIKNNTDRIAAAKERGTLPYFLKDNEWTWNGDAKGTLSISTDGAYPAAWREKNKQIAKQRHDARPDYYREAIQAAWENKFVEPTELKITEHDYLKDILSPDFSLENINRILKKYGLENQLQQEKRLLTNAGVELKQEKYLTAVYNEHFWENSTKLLNNINTVLNKEITPNNKKMPRAWKARFNLEYKNSFADGGIKYQNLTHCQNILNLAKTKAVRDIVKEKGWGVLSTKMPVELFDSKLKECIVLELKDGKAKSYFEQLKEYVECKVMAGSDIYFSPRKNYVRFAYDENTKIRAKTDPTFAKSVVYHEFGHAIDHISDIGSQPLMKRWLTAARAKFGNKEYFEKMIKKMDEIQSKGTDHNEAITLISDCYCAFNPKLWNEMTKSKYRDNISRFGGHSTKYMSDNDSCISEILAHAQEEHWLMFDQLQEIDPRLASSLKSLFAYISCHLH